MGRFTDSEMEQLDASKEIVANVAHHLVEAYMAAQASEALSKVAKKKADWLLSDAAELTMVLAQLQKFQNP